MTTTAASVASANSTEATDASDTSSDDTDETAASDTISDDTSTDDTEGDASTEEPTGGDLERWCELTSELSDDPFANVDEASPDDVEAAFDELETQMDEYIDAAPDQIREGAETVVNAFQELRDLVERHDYDLEAVATDPAFEEVIADPDVEAASDRDDEFEEANCP